MNDPKKTKPDNVVAFGGGGLLYKDARDQSKENARQAAIDYARAVADEEDVQLLPDEMVPDEPEPEPQPAPPSKIGKIEAPQAPRDWREALSTGLELAGIGFLIATGFLVAAWLGMLVTGICLVVLGVATSRKLNG
jgi:hypothetical protein